MLKTCQADITTTLVNVLNLQGDGGQPTLCLQTKRQVPFRSIFMNIQFPKSPDRFPLKLSNRILKRGNISMNFSCPSIYISGESHLYLSCNEIYRPGTRVSSSM